MVALRTNNTGKMPPDISEALSAYATFWKSATLDLPLVLVAESLRFMGHRLQAQADHIGSLTRCRTMSEALDTQATFTRTTVSDYAAETETMMQEARSVVTHAQAA